MSKKQKAPEYFLRLRAYPEGQFVSVWLLERHGEAAVECRLFGEVLPAVAEALVIALGLPVEREDCPLAAPAPIEQKQKEMF